jgi:hypothetical protein
MNPTVFAVHLINRPQEGSAALGLQRIPACGLG